MATGNHPAWGNAAPERKTSNAHWPNLRDNFCSPCSPSLLSVWMWFLLHAGLCPRVARIRFLIFLRRLDRADHGVVVAGCILVPFGIVWEVIKLIYHTATETRFSWREVASRLFGTHQNTHTKNVTMFVTPLIELDEGRGKVRDRIRLICPNQFPHQNTGTF